MTTKISGIVTIIVVISDIIGMSLKMYAATVPNHFLGVHIR